jgi:hypothetical protein
LTGGPRRSRPRGPVDGWHAVVDGLVSLPLRRSLAPAWHGGEARAPRAWRRTRRCRAWRWWRTCRTLRPTASGTTPLARAAAGASSRTLASPTWCSSPSCLTCRRRATAAGRWSWPTRQVGTQLVLGGRAAGPGPALPLLPAPPVRCRPGDAAAGATRCLRAALLRRWRPL